MQILNKKGTELEPCRETNCAYAAGIAHSRTATLTSQETPPSWANQAITLQAIGDSQTPKYKRPPSWKSASLERTYKCMTHPGPPSP